MTEAFNDFFTTIGPNLVNKILPSDIKKESYPQPTDKAFSLKTPSVSTVCELLSQINEKKKAMGLDRIPCKLLQLATHIVAPSLTKIFKSCIDQGIFPSEWKIAKLTPTLKKGVNLILAIIDQYLYYLLSKKSSKNYLSTALRLLKRKQALE